MELTRGARALSKSTLDWAVFDGKSIILQSQSTNSESGIKTVLKLIKTLPGFQFDLGNVDKQIDQIIQNDNRLKELFEWITSVPGVGSTTATEVIVATNEFKVINKPKKPTCHAGVAPFEYKSGSSVRTVGRCR